MGRFLRLNLSHACCKSLRIALSILWISGLLFGIIFSFSADTILLPAMLSALHGRLSIICFLSALLLPLLITVFSVYISQPCLIFALVFLKAFLFAFVGFGVLNSFDSSAWLLQCLFMFSDSLILPIFWWLWLQSFSKDQLEFFRNSMFAALGVLLIGCFDYALIAPFLGALL